MDFFDWQGAGGVNSELLTTSATQPGGSAPPKKDAILCCVMGWDWYYVRSSSEDRYTFLIFSSLFRRHLHPRRRWFLTVGQGLSALG
ncbi:hypothetical protein ASE07_22385 [Noviherbaspirillum sp. Root189]|nr:hypothetical protein ASE07_22385 [Noviherbaspirillum sp. Root189]